MKIRMRKAANPLTNPTVARATHQIQIDRETSFRANCVIINAIIARVIPQELLINSEHTMDPIPITSTTGTKALRFVRGFWDADSFIGLYAPVKT